jgi:hypothetical protein
MVRLKVSRCHCGAAARSPRTVAGYMYKSAANADRPTSTTSSRSDLARSLSLALCSRPWGLRQWAESDTACWLTETRQPGFTFKLAQDQTTTRRSTRINANRYSSVFPLYIARRLDEVGNERDSPARRMVVCSGGAAGLECDIRIGGEQASRHAYSFHSRRQRTQPR